MISYIYICAHVNVYVENLIINSKIIGLNIFCKLFSHLMIAPITVLITL